MTAGRRGARPGGRRRPRLRRRRQLGDRRRTALPILLIPSPVPACPRSISPPVGNRRGAAGGDHRRLCSLDSPRAGRRGGTHGTTGQLHAPPKHDVARHHPHPVPRDVSRSARHRPWPAVALATGVWSLDTTQHPRLRRPLGRHRSVDDTPFGGGAGMVLRPDVVDAAISGPWPTIAPSCYASPPAGRPFRQADAPACFASGPGHPAVRPLRGHRPARDRRSVKSAEEISIGDYVLSGGELAAMVVLDSMRPPAARRDGRRRKRHSRKASAAVCWNTPTTPAPPNGRGAIPCPTCC